MEIVRLLWRGLLRRCPRCGSGALFERWTEMRDACPRCGLVFANEEGYWVGAMTVNIVVTELLFVAMLVPAIVLTWPAMPVWRLVALGSAINLLFPIIFYPASKTLWVALDLAFLNPHRRTWTVSA